MVRGPKSEVLDPKSEVQTCEPARRSSFRANMGVTGSSPRRGDTVLQVRPKGIPDAVAQLFRAMLPEQGSRSPLHPSKEREPPVRIRAGEKVRKMHHFRRPRGVGMPQNVFRCTDTESWARMWGQTPKLRDAAGAGRGELYNQPHRADSSYRTRKCAVLRIYGEMCAILRISRIHAGRAGTVPTSRSGVRRGTPSWTSRRPCGTRARGWPSGDTPIVATPR